MVALSRGLLAMANAGKDDNGSQFFFTLASTPELQNKHTIFGKVTGETVYNMIKLEEALTDVNDRPVYPQKIIKTEILTNPFDDIEPRIISVGTEEGKEKKKDKKSGVKNFKLLSFGEEAEEDEEESVVLNKLFSGKGKSAHDNLADPELSAQPAIEPSGPPSKKRKKDCSSNWESEDDTQTPEELAAMEKEKEEVRERIKNKLKGSKNVSDTKTLKDYEVDDEGLEEEEYYLGKDRVDERKRKAEEIRKEIRGLKREMQKQKKEKEVGEQLKVEQEEKKEKHTGLLKEYMETQEKYKEATSKIPKKGASRQDFALQLMKQFKSKLQSAKEHVTETTTVEEKKVKIGEEDDPNDDSWMTHTLCFEEKAPTLAKDASTKGDDWFEIYDPRNPLNKRRRGEKSEMSKKDKVDKRHSHH